MFRLPAALKAKGEEAEAAFRAWLNWSGVAFLYVEQSRLNVPERLRGKIKRPDYMIGIPHAGMMAIDVKAKSAYDDCLLFDVGELKKLSCFSDYFHVSVSFACLNLDEPGRFYWVPLSAMAGRAPEKRGRAWVVPFPLAEALSVATAEPFITAYARFSERTLGL
ncbi:hypothetical protein HEP89_29580 (plasmid) [Labrenzia sp. 5N]|uniref:hypothetical protein n=1 Tax=Labrenzia sp. 5N TaxID=2723402 RepID=UPI001446F230|nr:hypothetical protein [Labrenzia sp. 5N]NKX68290.1 hypothetical protein [Labrenzia sp. 5N]